MPTNYPLASAGAREPDKRPRPIPKIVKDACLLMVYGDPADEDGAPIDFISAAKSVGMQPPTLRKYLTRPDVVKFLRAERRAFRESICASNELTLLDVRNNSSNGMARLGAVRALEQLEEAAEAKTPAGREQIGLTIRILAAPSPAEAGPVIDVTPTRADNAPEPVFKPRR